MNSTDYYSLPFHLFYFLVYYRLHGGISGSVSLFNGNHVWFQTNMVNHMAYWFAYSFKVRYFGGEEVFKTSVFVVHGEFVFGAVIVAVFLVIRRAESVSPSFAHRSMPINIALPRSGIILNVCQVISSYLFREIYRYFLVSRRAAHTLIVFPTSRILCRTLIFS